MKLSVLMPAYNEREWIEQITSKVLAQKVPGIADLELIIVDDHSNDGTTEMIKALSEKFPQKICPVFHSKNLGKGAAICSAIEKISGEICIIQDADLEYDPGDYERVLKPIIDGHADCVFGSRFIGSQSHRVLFYWHYIGNQFLTLLSNMFTNLNLTDMEAGYKAFRADIIKTIPIRSRDFGFEPEITAKVAQRKCRVYEVGISYSGRTYQEGKKIIWVDGFKAILVILKFSLVKDCIKR